MRAFFANVKYDNSVLACFLCPPFSTVRVEQKLAISSVRLVVYHTVCVLAIRGVGVCVDTASSLVPVNKWRKQLQADYSTHQATWRSILQRNISSTL